MKAFNRLFFIVIIMIIALFLISNFMVLNYEKQKGKPYLVEVSRLVREIENNNFKQSDLEKCDYIINIIKEEDNFYNSNYDYVIREIDGEIYRFDYKTNSDIEKIDLLKINFIVEEYNDCILNGDLERSFEVVQNIMENAIKYGDGKILELIFQKKKEIFG